jgi:sugar fermentation stimulation protein A
MILPTPQYSGKLIKRYKRFLADIKLDNGKAILAHCPNSGSMKSCNMPGSLVIVSKSDNPKRKLEYTWELIQVNGSWVGINTNHPNKLVHEGITTGKIKELQGYSYIKSEVIYGDHSRVDLLLEDVKRKCFIEVKNVTLVENGTAMFPDAETKRGQKHLRELTKMIREGHRSVIFFVVQRLDGKVFKPADHIDKAFGEILRQATREGVEAIAYQASVSPQIIELFQRIPIEL